MTAPNNQALAKISPPPGTPTRPILDQERLALDVWSSFADTPENRPLIIGLMQGQAEPIADYIGKALSIENILLHRVDVVDKDGVVVTCDRAVLVDPEGNAYGGVSEGIVKSLRLLVHYYGMPPWNPALRVEVQQITTRRGFRTFTLKPLA